MQLKWSHVPFNQNVDAYIDWIVANENYFPPGYEKYRISGILIYNPKDSDSSSGEASDFEILNRLEILGFTQFISPIFLEFKFLGDVRVLPALAPIANWKELVEELSDKDSNDGDVQIIVGRPIPDDAVCCERANNLDIVSNPNSLPDGVKPVIIGVIDEGLAFANERFRNDITDSRVEFSWLQDGKCGPAGVPGYNYGRELTKWDRVANGVGIPGIDTLLARSLQGNFVDEDLFYSIAGVADFGREGHKAAAWRVSHGTHVMDIAAGYDMSERKLARHIVTVQLPTSIVADTSGLGLEKFMIDGVAYIFDRAKRISERYYNCTPLPVVINFSSGVRAGPHDGTSLLESALDELISERRKPEPTCGVSEVPTQVVLPAGNSFQARSHVRFSFKKKTPLPVPASDQVSWHVPPDDRTFSYVELWLPEGLTEEESSEIALEISAPGTNKYSVPLVADPTCETHGSIALQDAENCGRFACKAYFQTLPVQASDPQNSDTLTKRGRYLIALAPTAFHSTEAALTPAGTWTIKLSYTGDNENLVIHGWIHWDDSPINYVRFGRQSFFEHQSYQRFGSDGELLEEDNEDTPIQRTGTINAIATGAEPKVVGAYRASDGRASSYTSADFENHNRKPDYMAVSETSYAHLGILAAGTRSGSTVALNGTSVAAPQVTRAIADLMSCGCTDQEIQEKLGEKAQADDKKLERRARSRNPNRQPTVQKERRGKGRLKLDLPRPSNGLRGEFGS
ncbi:hypothetical protein IWQ52_000609 [Labrenzia sp. EL_159]|nr:hypothetical protein [Labrenzia sp. EL_162]MBG6193107.1 hypothetical protein [Labrenzia sp. EL_159]